MLIENIYIKFSQLIEQFVNTIISLLKIIILSKFNIRLPKAENEVCIILGNGPSLKTSLQNNPLFFKKHSLVCVNSYCTTKEYTLLKPQYYVISDPSWWVSDNKLMLDTLEDLRTKTTWDIQLFVPKIAAKSKRFTDLFASNKNIHLNYFNYTVFKGFPSIAHFFYTKNMAMPQSQNVLVASIFLSINIGFKKIFLVGADHTWHQNMLLDENNILCFKDLHFYDGEEKITYKPFKKGVHIDETFKTHEIFTTLSKVFLGYFALKEYSKYKQCKIYNASEVTFIDAFERIKLPNN